MKYFRINQEKNIIKVKELISKQWLYAHLETIFVVTTMLLIILATFKYVSHGETYVYEVQGAEDKIELNNNIVRQDIVIDENAEWGKYSYAVYLYVEEEIYEGVITVTLSQWGGVVDSAEIRPVYIKTGWNELRGLDYSKLETGYATIQLSGQDLDKSVYVGIKNNVYNIPNCSINDEATEYTLEQRYHYNFNNFEYKLRCAVYILFILISIIGTYIVCTKEDSVRTSNFIRSILIISYMCLTFIYDSSLWLSPTYTEAVTNFLHFGLNETLWENIIHTDAGYLPLFQRLIAVTIIKGLRLPAYYALFAMQAAAYFISGFILSFFSKYQFKEYFSLKNRYLLSLLFIIVIIFKDTEAFISFMVYGFMIIIFYFLVDSKVWTRREFVTICIFSCLACMSKGTYVTTLPFMILCTILFFKNYSRRDYVFSISCGIGALLQLIYFFIYRHYVGDVDWIDVGRNRELDFYYIKLILKSMIDVTRSILMVFSDKIDFFNSMSIIIFVSFWSLIIYLFVKEIFLKYIFNKKINRCMQLLFVAVIYIFMQSLFLRITILGVTENDVFSDEFWTFQQFNLGLRYQVPIFIAVFMLFIVTVKILQEKNIKYIQAISIVIFIFYCMIGQPRLQLKGIGNDDYVAQRTRFADLNAEYKLFKNLENVSCRVVPIQQTAIWVYRKNANINCLGDNKYIWPVSRRNYGLESIWTGDIVLGDYPINTDCGIWQVFIIKLNLIERSNYQILLLDKDSNIIYQQYQDNTNYQKFTSFTFDTSINDVNEIVILDGDGNEVYIENSMYIVTEEDQQYFME